MKLPNIKKDQMAIDLLKQLSEVLPERNPMPPYLLVDDDVYSGLKSTVSPSFIQTDFILHRGWKVISRGMICELGDGK